MVTAGVTVHEPDILNEFVPEPEHESAFVEFQERVELPPGEIVLGVTVKVTETVPTACDTPATENAVTRTTAATLRSNLFFIFHSGVLDSCE